jgi:hypothetical protein
MSPATPFVPGSELPAALLVGASARCLLDELLERCLAPLSEDRGAEIERLPAAALSKEKEDGALVPAVLARLGNASLFGARRALVVLGGQELLRDDQVKKWIEKPTPRTTLIVAVVRAAKDGLPAVPAKLPVATLWDPGPQSPAELARFLERRLKSRGASATPAALEALREQAGASLDALDAELEKLALYRLGATIDVAHVHELCGHTAGRDFDRLWQAARAGRLGEALAIVETMGREGLILFGGGRAYGSSAVANALLPMFLARIRRVVAVGATGEKLVAAAADAFGMKPGYVHFLQQDARALGPRLSRWQAAAVAAEVRQKRVGLESEEELLEGLLSELARA